MEYTNEWLQISQRYLLNSIVILEEKFSSTSINIISIAHAILTWEV